MSIFIRRRNWFLSGLFGSLFRQQPAVFKDQVHEPGENETVVLLIDSEAIMVDFRRVGMDVGIVEFRLLSGATEPSIRARSLGFRLPNPWLAGIERGAGLGPLDWPCDFERSSSGP